MKTSVLLAAALPLLFVAEAYAGCTAMPQRSAYEALRILESQIMVTEYCESCQPPSFQPVGVRSTGLDCNGVEDCRVILNGKPVDVANLFAANADGREENIGHAVGCPDAVRLRPRFLDF